MRMRLILAAAIALCGSPASAAPVTNAAGLSAALAAAKGGETIELAAGDFGFLYLGAKAYAAPVTIASATPARPAHFSGMQLSGSTRLRFVDLDVGRALAAGEPEYLKMVQIYNGADLAFIRGKIHGSLDNNPLNDAWGVYAADTIRLTFSGVRFEELMRGVVTERAADVLIERSDFDGIRSDAIDIPGTVRVEIVENLFRRFRPIPAVFDAAGKMLQDGDHPDVLQAWTASQTIATADVLFARNAIEGDPIWRPQGVFFGDEAGLKAKGAGYKNVTVSANLFISPMWHAILVADVEGAHILDNVIVNLPGGGRPETGGQVRPWIYAAASAELRGNTSPHYIIGGANVAAPAGNIATGDVMNTPDAAAALAAWRAKYRATVPADPRLAERAALRLSIPIETATRDALTKKLAKDRARLKALDKALGQ